MKLVLAHHTFEEWAQIRADQARRLECSEEYIKSLVAQLWYAADCPPVKS